MGTIDHSSSLELIRELAARQGVHPSEDDLQAVQAFLDTILPQLEELEALLPPETTT